MALKSTFDKKVFASFSKDFTKTVNEDSFGINILTDSCFLPGWANVNLRP